LKENEKKKSEKMSPADGKIIDTPLLAKEEKKSSPQFHGFEEEENPQSTWSHSSSPEKR